MGRHEANEGRPAFIARCAQVALRYGNHVIAVIMLHVVAVGIIEQSGLLALVSVTTH